MVSLHHNWTNICCSVWPCSYRLGFASYSFMNRIYKNWKVLKLYWIFYYPFFGSFVVCPIIILSLIYFPSFVCMCMMCLCLMYIECWDQSIIINRSPLFEVFPSDYDATKLIMTMMMMANTINSSNTSIYASNNINNMMIPFSNWDDFDLDFLSSANDNTYVLCRLLITGLYIHNVTNLFGAIIVGCNISFDVLIS